MSEDEQIKQIKNNFLTTVDPDLRKKNFDLLALHGDKGIAMINELSAITIDGDVKTYGLNIIQKMKSDTSKPWEIEGDISSDET